MARAKEPRTAEQEELRDTLVGFALQWRAAQVNADGDFPELPPGPARDLAEAADVLLTSLWQAALARAVGAEVPVGRPRMKPTAWQKLLEEPPF